MSKPWVCPPTHFGWAGKPQTVICKVRKYWVHLMTVLALENTFNAKNWSCRGSVRMSVYVRVCVCLYMCMHAFAFPTACCHSSVVSLWHNRIKRHLGCKQCTVSKNREIRYPVSQSIINRIWNHLWEQRSMSGFFPTHCFSYGSFIS